MEDMELAVELEDSSRFNAYEDTVNQVLKTLSVTSEYPTLQYTKETGPGLFLVQKLDEGKDDFAERSETNAWYDLNNGEDVYLDDDPWEVYQLMEESVIPDGATVSTPHGEPVDYNQHFYVPDEIQDEVDTTSVKGSKHKSAKAVSTIPNIWWTKVLSAEDGSIVTYQEGERAHPPVEREDLIDEVNEGDAEWLINQALESDRDYDWLDTEGLEQEIQEEM